MEIAKKFGELTKPDKYGPYLIGGAAGAIGGAMAYNWVLQQAAAHGDMADWGARIGFTAVAAVGMMSITPTSSLQKGLWAAALSAGVVGTIGIAAKLGLAGMPVIGRAGPVRGGISVVGKPSTPTYAQARPVAPVQAPARAEEIVGF